MRVAKTDTIAGLPAILARSIVRKFRGREMVAEVVADLLEGTGYEHEAVLAELEAAGYMAKVRVDTDGDIWWDSTIQGNALAMASFGKPISRKTADRLVAGLVERAQAYNGDPGKPLFINTLRVFGSYLSPDVDPLGDVDIELTYGRRITDRQALSDYSVVQKPLLELLPRPFQRADNGYSVNLPQPGKPLSDQHAAGTGGAFHPSMAGVNSGYPRLEIASRWGSSRAAVAVDNLRELSPAVAGGPDLST